MDLKEIRKQLNINVAQMSELCGVDRDTYSQWERGRRKTPAIAIQHFKLLLWLNKKEWLEQWKSEQQNP